MVFLEGAYSFLLLVHLFVTFVLVGSMTHGLLIVIDYLRGKFNRQKLEWLYVRVALWSYVIVYVIGALIYPAYRIYIRHNYFDPQLPWATGLFEAKEHWAVVGMAMFFVYYFLRKNLQPAEEKDKLWLYVPLCFLLNIIVWYKVVVGCYLTILKGSWS
jgi:amino acid transporter